MDEHARKAQSSRVAHKKVFKPSEIVNELEATDAADDDEKSDAEEQVVEEVSPTVVDAVETETETVETIVEEKPETVEGEPETSGKDTVAEDAPMES